MLSRPLKGPTFLNGPGMFGQGTIHGGILSAFPEPFVGSPMEDMGQDGVDGHDGTNGTNGANGTNGTNGEDGTPGGNGSDGTPGTNGTDGTPGTNGADGQPGVPGPKDSVVKTSEGTYAFACMEGSRPWFFEIVPPGGDMSRKFLAAVEKTSLLTFTSEQGCKLVMGVRLGFADWNMPDKTPDQMKRANDFWSQAT